MLVSTRRERKASVSLLLMAFRSRSASRRRGQEMVDLYTWWARELIPMVLDLGLGIGIFNLVRSR